MTLTQKALKEAKAKGKKVDGEVIKGLRAIDRLHRLIKASKGSPYKTWEKMHAGK